MDIKEVQNLIRFVAKAGVSEVEYKTEDFEIKIKTNNGVETVFTQAPIISQSIAPQINTEVANNGEAKIEEDVDSNLVTIKSPMVGTFYRKPSPDKDPVINVGDIISEGSIICIIEAMKLFNEIESEISGKIVKILVDDASPVEYDQPLFLVDPS